MIILDNKGNNDHAESVDLAGGEAPIEAEAVQAEGTIEDIVIPDDIAGPDEPKKDEEMPF